ncbi:ABC transporter permease [Calothrix sp. NIES-3974]|uniref:ABC transporter permease n=1 Tax=Calothrix sp. NIES-3974 TaxID=2005462 RepID=UPI000B5E6294|nr:iron export ABC transporter permease subunit FetB [Calothrix sp. NIES-3974]BAZ08043.1 hypothetical protein NIES3974_47120 [Calothrix sp. NIES-3974]
MVKLDLIDLVSAIALVCVTIGLSAWQRLGLELSILIACGRVILQLMVLGYVLSFVVAVNNPGTVLVILAVMLTVSALFTRNRISQKIPCFLPLVWIALFLSTGLAVFYTNYVIIQPQQWYEARYIIPIAAMVLSSAISSSAIAGESLVKAIDGNSQEIETHLCLGATPEQAVSKYQRTAMRAGLIPTINQMMLIGMVTIPDFVNGQLLAGIPPEEAVSYQIIMAFVVLFANMLATLLIVNGICRQYFNANAQLIR